MQSLLLNACFQDFHFPFRSYREKNLYFSLGIFECTPVTNILFEIMRTSSLGLADDEGLDLGSQLPSLTCASVSTIYLHLLYRIFEVQLNLMLESLLDTLSYNPLSHTIDSISQIPNLTYRNASFYSPTYIKKAVSPCC